MNVAKEDCLAHEHVGPEAFCAEHLQERFVGALGLRERTDGSRARAARTSHDGPTRGYEQAELQD